MKKIIALSLSLGCLLAVSATWAADLKQSKFTQVVNDVKVISGADKSQKPASVNDPFTMPDILRTGPASRAELVAEDKTITRVGANTIFSFDPASRTINLEQGSLLFHSPRGKGGGTIRTGSATASVLGTTIIVVVMPTGGFKVLVLEGAAEVRLLSGVKQHLEAGQMTFVLPSGEVAPVIVFRLDELVKGSQLIMGFLESLPSLGSINDEIANQLNMILNGQAEDMGLFIGNNATPNTIEAINVPEVIDSSSSGDSSLSALDRALATDATINGPVLDPSHVFTSLVTIPGSSFLTAINPYFGFIANNIIINTPTIDLSSYSGLNPFFDIAANGGMDIQGSVNFAGLTFSDALYLDANGPISIASGATVETDAGLFFIGTGSMTTWNGVVVKNNAVSGELEIVSPLGISLTGSQILADGIVSIISGGPVLLDNSSSFSPADAVMGFLFISGSTVTLQNNTSLSADAINLIASSTLSLSGATLNAGTLAQLTSGGDMTIGTGANINGGSLIANSGGDLTVNGSANISSTAVTLTAANNLFIDGSLATFGGSGTFAASAPNVLGKSATLNNADLTTYSAVNLAAHTLNLMNVAFGPGSTVNLSSSLGLLAPLPNTGVPSLPGFVNFISGVTYNGQPAQNFVNTILNPTGPITISAMP